jgi:hypothetical protein
MSIESDFDKVSRSSGAEHRAPLERVFVLGRAFYKHVAAARPGRADYSKRRSIQCKQFTWLLLLILFSPVIDHAQEKPDTIIQRSTCSRESALGIIQRQIDLSKTIDNDPKRITLLIRAADLSWPREQDKARAAFSEAFEIATRFFKEKGVADTKDGRFIVAGTDYRYTVITAIARRDPDWAAKLSQQILKEEADAKTAKTEVEAAKDAAGRNPAATHASEQLMNIALALLDSDQDTAVKFARSTLQYPATFYMSMFVFKLAGANRGLADQFYVDALNAYAQAPMNQFLYLSSYPFAANREIGEMPAWTYYQVPNGLAPNPALQRLFVATLLDRAQALVKNPPASDPEPWWTENSQVFMALSRVGPLIGGSLPDLASQVTEARANIGALLTPPEHQRTSDILKDPPRQTFDEIIEAADKLADAGTREARIALAILNAAQTGTESVEKLESAGMKLDDIYLRKRVMSLAYFYRSQQQLNYNKVDEARRLAAKVEEPDQRAYLYAQIAGESLKQKKSDADVREMLEDVLDAVAKSGDSEVKVRAMLVVVHLYSVIDANRAVSLLGDVVKSINHIESIDLAGDRLSIKVEGRAFGSYSGLQTPGFSPEVVFREMGKIDFDGTMYLASNLNDKSIRGLTTLALADQCLKDLPPPPKPKANKPVPPKPE